MTGRRPRRLLTSALGAAALAGVALAPGPVPARAAPPVAAEEGHAAPDVQTAIDRGVAHLVATQRKDGSWGTTASNLWDIYAPVPGSFHAFQSAVTALATSALVEVGEGKPGAAEAVRRGADFLLANHAKARRVSPDTMYNVWTHAYVLEAFARLLAKETDAARKTALLEQSKVAVDLLGRFESVNGGWGYYDFEGSFRQPGQFTTSFTTATCLLALKAAKDAGVDVPKRLVDRGVALVEKLKKPDGSYAYSWDHLYWPQGGINKIKGSLGRTSVCDLALKAWGKEVPPARAEKALSDLETFGHFLRIARKYPIPHETWYQNSGYFCFYGYYYAAQYLETLPAEKRAPFAKQMASHLLPLQEQDGSWWDYQLYSYHKPYGTAYVLMALGRCR